VAEALGTLDPKPLDTALQERSDRLGNGLEDAAFDVVRPEATYFATADVRTDAITYCRDLPHRVGVACSASIGSVATANSTTRVGRR
jgi:N-succinyldiaminopimelate aminotransferase